MRFQVNDIETDEDEYPQEATIGDQWLREPWKPFKQALRQPRYLNATEIHRKIAEVAYQLFVRQGRRHGHQLDHWLAAEKMVYSQLTDREQETGEHPDGKEAE